MTNEHFAFYRNKLFDMLSNIDSNLESISDLLVKFIQEGRNIFVCGNGGSSSITEHLLCDTIKCINLDTGMKPRVFSLPSNLALITAIANDIGYEEIFSYQLEVMGQPNDVLLVISSSGNSPNIVNALLKAKEIGMYRLAFTGFDGGKAKELSNKGIHIPAHNYGIVEDVHHICMHMITQNIRLKHSNKSDILKL